MKEAVGFIGLGELGLPVAANLMEAGYRLSVYNRTASKADPLIARGAERASRPADAVKSGGIVISLLWDDAAAESVATDHDFLPRLGKDGIHISMSTLSPQGSRKLSALHAEHGSIFIEAPIFGRPEAAEARKLTVVCAGQKKAKDRIWPLFKAAGAQDVFDLGERIGAATTVKLVRNLLIISAGTSLAEGLSLAQSSGIDPTTVIEIMASTLLPQTLDKTTADKVASSLLAVGNNPHSIKDLGLLRETAQALGLTSEISDALLLHIHR